MRGDVKKVYRMLVCIAEVIDRLGGLRTDKKIALKWLVIKRDATVVTARMAACCERGNEP
jgi:hypothetical protein